MSDRFVNQSELEQVLEDADVSFAWDECTHTWQLYREGTNGYVWRSVMYLAENQENAVRDAIQHITSYYL